MRKRRQAGFTSGEVESSSTQRFAGEIVVASRIVDYLSSGLYESPAACLKELINNSYDADAMRVNVFVKPDADRIIIEDDGVGMTRADFEKHFTKISESHKRDESDFTDLGRPKIGKIGIGFIAANEICDVMELFSTKQGSTELLHVRINFDVMRNSISDRRRPGEQLAKADYEGEILAADMDEHYTVVFLKNIRGEARSILAGAAMASHSAGSKSLYGVDENRVESVLRTPEVDSWSEFDSYTQNMLQVALNVPISYHENWMPKPLSDKVRQFERATEALNFEVTLDGSDLRKPAVFNPPGLAFVESFSFDGTHVSASGYFYVQHKAIRPRELQGLLIRIRHAAIGDYDQSFLDFSSSEGPLFQTWISAEVWADDRLEDAMNIDRKTLRVAHPAYVELQAALHQRVSGILKRARSELYGAGSRQRNVERAHDVQASIVAIADSMSATLGRSAVNTIKRTWSNAMESEEVQKRLLRKFSVADLYRIVLDVATEVLSPSQAREFVRRLTERLGR